MIAGSLSARRAWIEINDSLDSILAGVSLSARRAWIEITAQTAKKTLIAGSLSARRAWIEIISEVYANFDGFVALRKESVDRNIGVGTTRDNLGGRSPQGERG